MPLSPLRLRNLLEHPDVRSFALRDTGAALTDRELKQQYQERRRRKTAASIADSVLSKIASADPYREYAADVQEQHGLHGEDAVRRIISKAQAEEVLSALDNASNKQTLMGLGGGLAGSAVGGLGGALTSALWKGKEHARSGALWGILPGAVAGYVGLKNWQQRREIADILRERQ